MTAHQVFVLILIQVIILLLPAPGLAKMFEKAGVAGWKAFVPFYNTWIMQKLAQRPAHWVFWQLIPVVGWFISMGIFVEFVKTFGKFRLYEHALSALFPVFYFPYVGYNKDDKFLGPEVVHKHKKTPAREWIDAAVFAVVAAVLIRTFVFEAYVIPTPSMEKTLLVNDFLFVSKFSYGPRLPNTPIALPFVHHSIPFTNADSYVEWIKIPYTRWFPSPVKRGDVVVFNFPAGDTVINRDEFQSQVTYYQACRELGQGNADNGRQIILGDPDDYPIVVRPIDKQENYIKRCVGVSGDTLQIEGDVVYINGQRQEPPPNSELYYFVTTNGQQLDADVMREKYNLDLDKDDYKATGGINGFHMLLTYAAKEKMIKDGFLKTIQLDTTGVDQFGVMPYDKFHNWARDNFGPVWIPKKGATITLTAENYAMYERVIRTYEGNKLEMRNTNFYINGKETNQYTFKMDYYWMMGDNRQDSQDSRYWGFVPEDHIVGSASLIWMSFDHGIRWKRLFNKIR
ncbi:MAG TPA: S26 family signal peptidase [Puia sp.]|jgi:signal peptidase I|nr:S26 family signal peptidase [Puia sp.]